MSMKVLLDRPPNYDEIARRFNVRGKPVLFAWGDTIYAPHGSSPRVAPHLMAHENVHGQRQLQFGSIEKWWERYLEDEAFRLDEEKMAHAAEFLKLTEMQGGTRAARRTALSVVAARLSNPMYRYRFSKSMAREYLENGHF